jgi:hypothetical protein
MSDEDHRTVVELALGGYEVTQPCGEGPDRGTIGRDPHDWRAPALGRNTELGRGRIHPANMRGGSRFGVRAGGPLLAA